MADMTVTVNGLERLAHDACRMVFGEDAEAGPQRPAPEPLLKLLADWPAASDAVIRVGLELPINFDISHEMSKDNVKSVVLVLHRVTVLHGGKKIGYALRTDGPGLSAIDFWATSWGRWKAQLRQAH